MTNLLLALQCIFIIIPTTIAGHIYNCSSEARCRCSKYGDNIYADCSHLRLHSVPAFNSRVIGIDIGHNLLPAFPHKLPEDVQYLNITRNNIQSLTQNILSKYKKLKFLRVSFCRLRHIELKTFSQLKDLVELDISNNNELSLSVISNISYDLQNSRIQILNFEKLQCTYGVSTIFKLNHMKYLKNTSLKDLNIAGNRITSIENGVFSQLPETLKKLNIADNMLSYGVYLFEFGFLSNVEILNASYQDTFHQLRDFLVNCNDTRFHEDDKSSGEEIVSMNLNISQTYADPSTFKVNTKPDEVKEQAITTLVNEQGITKLNNRTETSSATKQHINRLKSTRTTSHIKSSPRLINLHQISDGKFELNLSLYFPPKLRILYFHDNMYKIDFSGFHVRTYGVQKITHVYLRNNILYRMSGPVFNYRGVRYIDMSNNFCKHISADYFNNPEEVQFLNLSNNIIGSNIENDINGDILGNFKSLQNLDLSYNRIMSLPDAIFLGLTEIVYLNLSYNKLERFDIKCNQMRKLKLLDLSFNRIPFMSSSDIKFLSTISLGRKIYINLFGNQLACNCKNIEFIDWMKNSQNIFFTGMSNYTCVYTNSSVIRIRDIDFLLAVMRKDCASYTYVIAGASSAVLVIVTLVICGIIYRYRWTLRYWFYVAKRQYKHKTEEQKLLKRYHFDAFISYADEDRGFVKNNIINLERERAFNFCIHDRDFIPGAAVADNITNAIHNSRHTVCIMTPSFLRSYWCKFEINIARMETIYSRGGANALVMIILDKNVIKEMSHELISLVDTLSYIEYPTVDDHNGKIAFWKKVAETLESD